jgi:hypothetical protein
LPSDNGIRHPHYLICHAIRFLLEGIIRPADPELGLYNTCLEQPLHCLIAKRPLEMNGLPIG